jgi:hypothetical protein
MINYRVEIVQTNVFYIEAESPDQARDIATIDYIWDEKQTKTRRAEIVMTSVLELQKRRTLSLSLAVDTT